MGKSKLTKIEIAEIVTGDREIKHYGISVTEANLVISKFIDKLKDSVMDLNDGDRIELRGFGTFGVKQRQARLARNPKTGEEVKIPARKHPFFKPGRDMKRAIQKN